MTPERLQELKKLCDIARKGDRWGEDWSDVEEEAHKAIPELIAEVERLRKQLELCKEQRDWYAKQRPLAQATIDQYEEELEAVGKVGE